MSRDLLDDFDYPLDPTAIAQAPASEREGARLLVVDRTAQQLVHRGVRDLPSLLAPGDLLVVNATRVLPARLRGRKTTGGAAEALLLGEAPGRRRFRALVRCRGRLRPGQKFVFASGDISLEAELLELGADGEVWLAFAGEVSPYEIGETPLPPYIRRDAPFALDASRYQTVYAREPGSVAAPTAGLHLGESLLDALAERGVAREEIVLHVGPGTFRPLRHEDLEAGRLHTEPFSLSEQTARSVATARARGGRVVAVGTTTARVLESCAAPGRLVSARSGVTDLFLRPGCEFRVVDALLTNFHLPRSSLLLLVAAFAGRERVLSAYAEALRSGYRFFSYGDAMLVL